MNLGIIMSLFNQRYFRDALSTFCEFIPQMIFLNALFGYLCFLILLKCAHTQSNRLASCSRAMLACTSSNSCFVPFTKTCSLPLFASSL